MTGDSFQYFELSKVERIYCRRYLLQQIGLEFLLKDGSSVLFVFDNHLVRNSIYELIHSQTSVMKDYKSLDQITRMWQCGKKSNFEYLMYLNSEADRSFNDLTQYPVFPHIIKDYYSSILDIDNPNTYRDLSKPMGALNPQRLQYFKDRYNSMPPADEDLGIPPPFLYGTHYSTPAYVLFYLVRVAPEHMLCLQNGKFDSTDRMFNSMADTWESCLNNPADLKELIPEFYVGNGEFLLNSDDLDLGHRHTGGRLHDVELPPWAKNSRDFIRKCSKALESEYVSDHIHEWIDLIFGYKSMGLEAANSDNLYYYLTYEGAIDLESITDQHKRTALEIQIQEFGQTPKQLFSGPHPKRKDINANIQLRSHKLELHLSVNSKQSDIPISSMYQKTSSFSSNTITPTISTADVSMDESSEILNLGEEFRAEVERALSSDSETSSVSSKLIVSSNNLNSRPSSIEGQRVPMSASTTNISNTSITISPTKLSISSYFSDLALKTASITDRTLGTKLLPALSNTISTSSSGSVKSSPSQPSPSQPMKDLKDIIVPKTSFDQISRSSESSPSKVSNSNYSSKSISLLSNNQPMNGNRSSPEKNSMDNRVSPSIRMVQIPINIKQIFLTPLELLYKVHSDIITGIGLVLEPIIESSQIDSEIITPHYWKAIICTTSKDSSLKILEARSDDLSIVLKRSFTGSDPALSCCCLSNDAKIAYASSWDNYVYAYSITNARLLSKQPTHEDGATSIAMDDNNKFMLTGAWDGTVKLWTIKNGSLSSVPMAEFYDHENPVTSVSLTGDGKYAAAGAEDGKVIIWDVRTGVESTSYQLSVNGRGQMFIKWIPSTELYYNQAEFSTNKLIASSHDRRIACFDVNGRLYAAATLDVTVLCLDCDGVVIYGGCNDGSIRVWILEGGMFKEIHRCMQGHDGEVSAIRIDRQFHILVTGGSDGFVRIWNTISN